MTNREQCSTWPAELDAAGRVLIPGEPRQAMGWGQGTRVVIESDGDSLRLLSLERFTREVQAIFGQAAAGEPLWSDELLAERRKEAECEQRGD